MEITGLIDRLEKKKAKQWFWDTCFLFASFTNILSWHIIAFLCTESMVPFVNNVDSITLLQREQIRTILDYFNQKHMQYCVCMGSHENK